MTDERLKQLMEQVGMPNSISLYGALQQAENEGFQAGAASRDAEVLQLQKLADEVHAARKVNAEHDRLLVKVAAKDAEIAELKGVFNSTFDRAKKIAADRDQLREQVKMLRNALITWGDQDTPLGVRIDTMVNALAATDDHHE